MKGVIKKDLLYLLSHTLDILGVRHTKDYEELKKLSEQAIEDVAVHKDMDLVSVTVLVYSIYKILPEIKSEEYQNLTTELKRAYQQLQANNLGRYNQSMKSLYDIVRRSNAEIKPHLQDVMDAARIKRAPPC